MTYQNIYPKNQLINLKTRCFYTSKLILKEFEIKIKNAYLYVLKKTFFEFIEGARKKQVMRQKNALNRTGMASKGRRWMMKSVEKEIL